RVGAGCAVAVKSKQINFFFQAEDGIRDRNVTGVQTCALPIFAFETGQESDAGEDRDHDPAVPPPGSLLHLLNCFADRGLGLVAAARRAHAPAPVPQQPGTGHWSSTHGACSSTASVTSTSAVSAAARCGSAIS